MPQHSGVLLLSLALVSGSCSKPRSSQAESPAPSADSRDAGASSSVSCLSEVQAAPRPVSAAAAREACVALLGSDEKTYPTELQKLDHACAGGKTFACGS